MSTVFMSFLVHMSILDFFTIRQKRIRGGGAFVEGNSTPLKHPPAAMNALLSERHS